MPHMENRCLIGTASVKNYVYDKFGSHDMKAAGKKPSPETAALLEFHLKVLEISSLADQKFRTHRFFGSYIWNFRL